MIGIFILSPNISSWAQNLTTQELIKKWKISNKYQTIAAEETYSDLKYNLLPSKFHHTIQELFQYLEQNPDDRLQIRIKMYQFIGEMEMNNPSQWRKKEEIYELIRMGLTLKDPQLLSELYSLYAERSYESVDNRVFYINKALQIQKEIGEEYFPKFYMRRFLAAYCYFNIQYNKEAIENGKECLRILEKPEKNLHIYILTMDMLGTLYFRQNDLVNSIRYYIGIKEALEDYRKNYSNYKEKFDKFDSDYERLWNAIADGGIARVLVSQNKLDDAYPLLMNNLEVSQIYDQKNDVAKVKNILGTYYEKKNNIPAAIKARRKAYELAESSQTTMEMIEASSKLDQVYKNQKQFDSAYYFNNKKHLAQLRLVESISESKIHSITNKLEHEKLVQLFKEAEQTIKQQRNTRNYILYSILIVILILLTLYKRKEFKQRLKFLELSRNKEIAELKLNQSQEEIKEAYELLEFFKLKLQHKQILLDSIKTGQSHKAIDIPELQNLTILTKEDWEYFKKQFNKVYPKYIFKLREYYPQISEAELRFLCLVKINLRHNEIASALGVSESTIRVTWHRMRKKFQVKKDISPLDFLKKFEEND
jgi:hypothetical protein